MQPRTLLCACAALALSAGTAVAQETVTLWHPFSLETDMIHGGIASFNESQDEYRVEARIVPGPQIATELVKFVYPLTLLSEQELQPATVGIYGFVGAEYADWHRVMAFSSVFVLPILVLFLLLQKRIVAGLTAGALK